MPEPLVYEASVYKRTVKYTNFRGETSETTLFFALDPLQLMEIIAGFAPRPQKRSGDPRKRNEPVPITDEEQLKFIRTLCEKAAGWPSDDGETWEPNWDFATSIAGKAFLTKLASSDADRREFTEKVILDPFRSFVGFAESDPENTPKEVQQFKTMLEQMENILKTPVSDNESLEDRKARLAAELASLEQPTAETRDS